MGILSTAAAAQTCDGRYDDAVALIDKTYSQYGTLYSGGPSGGTVGPTLEVYRMLSGLPDSGMADPRPSAPFIDPEGDYSPRFVGQTLARVLPRLSDPDFRRDTPEGSYDVEALLYRLTPIGPYAGWWLTPDAPQLTANEHVIAQYAVDDGLDWLLSVQSTSTRPHTISWHLMRYRMPQDMAAVQSNIAAHYTDTPTLPWFVAAYVVEEINRPNLRHLTERYDTLYSAVENCTASPAQYLATAIATYERLRLNDLPSDDLEQLSVMPPILRRMAAVQLAKFPLTSRWYHRAALSPDVLAALSGDPAFPAWYNYGRSLGSGNLDDLIAINEGQALDPKTYRLLNLLSADDLLAFAQARPSFPDENRTFITAAFLRLFALGRDDDAADLVSDLQNLWPNRAALIAQNWEGSGDIGIRLARVALSLPEPRTLITPYSSYSGDDVFTDNLQADYSLAFWSRARRSRDLGIAMRTGGFLTRDLAQWMQTTGSAPYTSGNVARRMFRRGIIPRDVMDDVTPPLPQNSAMSYHTLGIASWAAWDEVSRLGPDTGLANRIGREIVLNARHESGPVFRRLFGADEQTAAELELVIAQGRRMLHGEMEGQPLGQVAFDLLHRNFAGTEAANATPYWFICRERCEP